MGADIDISFDVQLPGTVSSDRFAQISFVLDSTANARLWIRVNGTEISDRVYADGSDHATNEVFSGQLLLRVRIECPLLSEVGLFDSEISSSGTNAATSLRTKPSPVAGDGRPWEWFRTTFRKLRP